jgi:hypothetical protein
MDNFDNFMIHKVKYDYQPQGFSVQFGGGYSFDTDGGYPPLRKLTLTFKGYKFYRKLINGVEVIDREKNIDKNNMGALDQFYNDHLTNVTFEYHSPIYGTMLVRFAEPLGIPEIIEGSDGVCEQFNVVLKEVFV